MFAVSGVVATARYRGGVEEGGIVGIGHSVNSLSMDKLSLG